MITLDLFAGAGGWDVAARELGHTVAGVENWIPAQKTRQRNGLATLFGDVWEPFLPDEDQVCPGFPARKALFDFWPLLERETMLIASPPCQTFSVAGQGAGRAALNDVLLAIDHYDTALRLLGADPDQTLTSMMMAAAGELRQYVADAVMDERTALVLVPLLYVDWLLPTYILLEQVPSVLPVWAEYAQQLRRRGYDVDYGIVHAEQYGVPQTRKRAVLLARRDGLPVTAAKLAPARWIEDALPGREGWKLRSNYGTSGDKDNRGERYSNRPAFTVTGKVNRNKWVRDGVMENVTPEEAAVLQSFPSGFEFVGSVNERCEQIGNAVPPLLARALIEAVTS